MDGSIGAGAAVIGGAGGKDAKIGPNAVIQLAAALNQAGLDQFCLAVFAAVGVADWLDHPPGSMVNEHKVAQLHQAVRSASPHAETVLRNAGRRTADYLLANRIPKPVQALLKILPARLAAFVLVSAIRRNAWTFAGSGEFAAHTGCPTIFEIRGNPLCAGETAPSPVCAWHAAVFERLFQVLVSKRARVTETDCAAVNGDCCRFLVDWRRKR